MSKRAICSLLTAAAILAAAGCTGQDSPASSSGGAGTTSAGTSGITRSTESGESHMSSQTEAAGASGLTQAAPTAGASKKSTAPNSRPAAGSKATSAASTKGGTAPTAPGEASVAESPLANTYKLLTTGEKKLTIGYIGGSITLGSSALQKDNGDGTFSSSGGNLMNSWVNRTSSWFKKTYPQAAIETVNAGVSDTATNFGLFRLEKTLMNTNGHDMPDLVFVEFTRNDWVYETQSAKDLERQAESLVRNIYQFNPYADIVFFFLAREESAASRQAYLAVAERYHIPTVDAGLALQKKMTERGAKTEAAGNYYYTVDNLHPSERGYEICFEALRPVLEKHLNVKLKDARLYNYKSHLPAAKNSGLLTNPAILPASSLKKSGKIQEVPSPVGVSMYGTAMVQSQVDLTPSYLQATGNATVSFEFKGTALGVLFKMNESDINMRYRIDDGDWKTFAVNDDSLGFQRRKNHQQVYMLAHALSAGNHKVQMVFNPSGSQAVNVMLGGVLTAGG